MSTDTPSDSSLDEHTAAHVAELFRAFSDTSRVRILYALSTREMNVNALAASVGISESAVSHHLRGLRQMKLVVARRGAKRCITGSRTNISSRCSDRGSSMSSKGDDQPPHAGLWGTLILLLCAFSLAAHAIGEWQGPAAAQPASEMTNQGGQSHPTADGEADELMTITSRQRRKPSQSQPAGGCRRSQVPGPSRSPRCRFRPIPNPNKADKRISPRFPALNLARQDTHPETGHLLTPE